MLSARNEQRRERREELFAGELVLVDLTSHSSAQRTKGFVLNLAEGGIAVQTFRPIFTGEVASIHLVSPKFSLRSEGIVAWRDFSGRAGVRFSEPLPDIAELCRDLHNGEPHSDTALPLFSCVAPAPANEFESTLHLCACSAMALTGASGVAIAVGSSSVMECRASVGSAPATGVQIRPGSGLSGESLSTGFIIFCNDALNDPRVHPAVAEQLQARSILTIPVGDSDSIVALITAFSPTPGHFSERHVHDLNPLIEVLGQAVSAEQTAPAAEVPVVAAPVSTSAHQHEAKLSGSEKLSSAILDDLFSQEFEPETSHARTQVADDDVFNYDVLKREVLNQQESETAEAVAPFSLLQNSLQKFKPAVRQMLNPATRRMLQPANRSVIFAVAIGIAALLLIIFALVHFGGRGRAMAVKATTTRPQTVASTAASAPEVKATASFSPQSIEAEPGKTFNVAVSLKGARNLWSAPMKIVYDPRQLQFVSISNGGFLSSDGVSAALVHRANATTGSLDISISRPLSSPGVSGDGPVVTLAFRAKSEGKSKLRIASSGLRDTATHPVSIDSSDATVTVAAPSSTDENSDDQTANASDSNQPSDSSQPSESDATLASASAPDLANPSAGFTPTASPADANIPRRTQPEDLPAPVLSDSNRQQIPANLAAGNPVLPKLVSPVPSFVLANTIKGHSNWVTSVAFSADGQRLMSSSWDNWLKMWDFYTGRTLISIRIPGTRVETAALSHDGRSIAIEDEKNNIGILNASTGEIRRIIAGQRPTWDSSRTSSIAFSPDDRLLAAAFDSSTIRIWEVSSGHVVRDLRANPRSVIFAAFSPSGRYIVTGGDARSIRLWEVATGKLLHTFKGHRGEIVAVAFSADGRWLASASRDRTAKLWDVASGRELRTFEGHEAPVTGVAFSGNGRWLATSSWDRTTRIWDTSTGKEVQAMAQNKHPLYSIAFASGYLASGSQDGTISLWKLNPNINAAVLNATPQTSSASAAPPR